MSVTSQLFKRAAVIGAGLLTMGATSALAQDAPDVDVLNSASGIADSCTKSADGTVKVSNMMIVESLDAGVGARNTRLDIECNGGNVNKINDLDLPNTNFALGQVVKGLSFKVTPASPTASPSYYDAPSAPAASGLPKCSSLRGGISEVARNGRLVVTVGGVQCKK